MYDYQKKVSEQTKEIADIQKQLAAYAGDTSEENRARIQKLRTSLGEAQDNLSETQYNQSISEQKELLDALYDEYEAHLNERLDNVDLLMNEMIEYTNQNAAEIKDTISLETQAVGYTITDEMNNIWKNGGAAQGVVATYGERFDAKLTSLNEVLNAISQNVANIVTKGNTTAAAATATATPTTAVTKPTPAPTPAPAPAATTTAAPAATTTAAAAAAEEQATKQVEIKYGRWWLYSKGPRKGKTSSIVHKGEVYDYLDEKSGFTKILYKGKERWVSSDGIKKIGFSQGGFVADLQKIAYKNGDDMVTFNTLKKGEAVFTAQEYQQIAKLVQGLPQIQDVMDATKKLAPLTNNMGGGNVTIDSFSVPIMIESVQDYNDFVRQLRDDRSFERMIEDMTIGKLTGGSSLAKKKYYN